VAAEFQDSSSTRPPAPVWGSFAASRSGSGPRRGTKEVCGTSVQPKEAARLSSGRLDQRFSAKRGGRLSRKMTGTGRFDYRASIWEERGDGRIRHRTRDQCESGREKKKEDPFRTRASKASGRGARAVAGAVVIPYFIFCY